MAVEDQAWACATGIAKAIGGALLLTLGSWTMYRGLEDLAHCLGQKLPWE